MCPPPPPSSSGSTSTGATSTSNTQKAPPPPPPPSSSTGSTSTTPPAPPPPPVGLGASLTFLGVIPAPPGSPPPPPAGSNTQLAKNEQKLNTDVSTFLKQSSVTTAELTALGADDQAIVAAKVKLDPKALTAAESDLANAIANGTYSTKTAALQAEFAALFTGLTMTKTAIAKAFGDVVAILQSSHVTTTYLKTVAADQAAIQADLAVKTTS